MNDHFRREKKIIGFLLPCALAGGIFSILLNLEETSVFTDLLINFKNGIIDGTLISGFILLYIIYLKQDYFKGIYKKIPFTITLIIDSILYLFFVLFGRALGFTITGRSSFEIIPLNDSDFIYSLFFAFSMLVVVNFIYQMNSLLGQHVLFHYIFGRYHRPKAEKRFVMFIDLRNSTAITEQIGADRFLALINDLFHDMTQPVLSSKGEIYKYIGDEAIITWKIRSHKKFGPLLFFENYNQILNANTDYYKQKYGLCPSFKAGVDFGTLYLGELGDIKQEITMVGDVLNTAARIVDEAKKSDMDLLCSYSAKNGLPTAGNLILLASKKLKGKSNTIELWGLKHKT